MSFHVNWLDKAQTQKDEGESYYRVTDLAADTMGNTTFQSLLYSLPVVGYDSL